MEFKMKKTKTMFPKFKKSLAVVVGLFSFSSGVQALQPYFSSSTLMTKAWGMQGPIGIDASAAWTQINGGNCSGSSALVAVVDTGIDMSHPDLKDSLWVNAKEFKGKPGVDDDNNGFVDDVHGWDFVTRSGKLVDYHGHGTHIAGIISATGKNANGFKGVCPRVKIMALRYYDEKASGVDNLRNTVAAIEYAVANGANILNYSGGGAEFSRQEFAALQKAEAKGILIVAAAGNEHANADQQLYFPAAYDLNNILSVTAIDPKGQILSSSNWGVKKVHVAAPGQGILSTLPGGNYGMMTGTSQATAFVSGIAALLKSKNKSLSVARLKEIIQNSAFKRPNLLGKVQTGASVNADAALRYLKNPKLYKLTSAPMRSGPSVVKKGTRSFSSLDSE